MQKLGLNRKVIIEELSRLTNAFDRWTDLIQKSFMADTAKELYLALLSNRRSVLGL